MMANDIERIEETVKTKYNATGINAEFVAHYILGGDIYYLTFKTPSASEEDGFCYALTTDPVQTFNDGVEAIRELQDELSRRRSFLQRLGEFNFTELVAAIIALSTTIAFIYLSITNQKLNQDFLGIFALIAGYYFGKNALSK